MSDASRWAALVLSASAPANSFRSRRPSRTLVSFGGWASRFRRDLRQQRLTVGELGGVGHLPARRHHIAEATGGVVDAARLGSRRWRWRVGIGRRRRVGVGRRGRRRLGSAGGGGGALRIGRRGRRVGSAGGGGGALGSAGGGGGAVVPGGGGGVGSGSACATVGSASAIAVAPVNAATASVFERPLRCSDIASGCSMRKKLPCYGRDASVSCSKSAQLRDCCNRENA